MSDQRNVSTLLSELNRVTELLARLEYLEGDEIDHRIRELERERTALQKALIKKDQP